MNKLMISLFSLILSFFHNPLSALIQNSVEVRAAAFFHSSDGFRDIYGDVSGCYEIEASTNLTAQFDVWANLDWFSKHGKSKGLEDSTRVNITNISAGVKYPILTWNHHIIPYIGIGASLGQINLKNESNGGNEKETKTAFGGVVKTGVYCFFDDCIFLDLFVDYLYQRIHTHTLVDIGGFKAGIGIGIAY